MFKTRQQSGTDANFGSSPQSRFALTRWLFFAFGLLSFALGFVGVFLPVLPTTPFMLLALWAFGKSSSRFERWLIYHKRFGPTLRNWREHRVIPVHGKVLASAGIFGSLCYLGCGRDLPWYALLGMSLLLGGVLCYILRRPSRVLGKTPIAASSQIRS